MNKKEKIDLFVRITRNSAKEEIKILQRRLNRRLTKKEKKQIIQKKANEARRKVKTIAFTSILGISAFTTGLGVGRLTSGNTNTNIAIENTETDKEKFFKSLSSSNSTENKEKSKTEKIHDELDQLESKEEILEYWKKLYSTSYQSITGYYMDINNLKIVLNNQNYVYVLDNEILVTHGKFPDQTEKAINEDWKSEETKYDVNIYQVVYNDKLIDGITTGGKQVIPGDNYTELKNNESILSDMGVDITNLSFKLIQLSDELSNNPKSEYAQKQYEKTKDKLAEAISSYKDKEKEIIINKEQEEPNNGR